jgi:hypothetical protein
MVAVAVVTGGGWWGGGRPCWAVRSRLRNHRHQHQRRQPPGPHSHHQGALSLAPCVATGVYSSEPIHYEAQLTFLGAAGRAGTVGERRILLWGTQKRPPEVAMAVISAGQAEGRARLWRAHDTRGVSIGRGVGGCGGAAAAAGVVVAVS